MSAYPSAPAYQEYPARPPPMGFPPPVGPPPFMPPPPAPAPPIVFGPESITLTCPHCHCMISTETKRSHQTCTHVCCCLLFCTLGLSLFSCLPYFFCDPESVEHTCPNCKAVLGVWHR